MATSTKEMRHAVNRVRFQAGLSMFRFLGLYGTEQKC